MRNLRKLLFIFMTIGLILPLSGCWDRKEVNELALVMAKAIDLTPDNRVLVSVHVAIPSRVGGAQTGMGGGSGGKSFFMISATGRSVSEADANVQKKLPRQLYLPHLRIILIGDRMAKTGMMDILDHFGRNPPNRLRTAILVAKDSDARSLLNTTYPLESLSGEAIRKLERQLTGSNTTLMDFMIQSASEGTDQMASAIDIKPAQESPGGDSSDTGGTDGSDSSSQGEESGDTEPAFSFDHCAVFRNLKLVGYLDPDDTMSLEWMLDRLKYTMLTMEVPKMGKTISVDLTQAHRRVRTQVQGNQVSVQYQLSGAAMLIENQTGLDADDPEVMKTFQTAVNAYVVHAGSRIVGANSLSRPC
ncbi:Ger(x)C family spore germination protein [Alicyclobacillus acidoterrestris]|uniref:Ger(X)C family spore germination protein n=1 Tax=Alicyclobacillus acidoterrestris (strain ATCC 49025 / DSM 3922 / CIP 106132 / NCIMB 13137 / GD3B) TaxID=1356854 RepID=T0CNT9_ALIAG|nr:Ger(x)C family spore germination protein [Alicyclobacillus acidoterrestris]EPZ41127.1 hypothetical protein N007_17320 [Alicyclobacillus acidoterrestris ATCC 49025]UNO47253.1 Ger(x)C family spore germination protein [Alicyclobacillus acidoterrestris]